jgi:Flp pilus assembly pilin Flp
MLAALSVLIRTLRADRRAVTAIEYALMGSLIMVAITAAVTTFTGDVNIMYNKIVNAM